jgi:hypothetical protein
MNNLKKYWKIAKANSKVIIGVLIVAIIILTWIF